MKLYFNISRLLYRFILVIVLVAIGTCPVFAIKIGLLTNANYANIAVSKPGLFIDGNTGKSLIPFKPMHIYTLSKRGNDIAVNINGHNYSLGSNFIRIKTSEPGFVLTKNKWYRGSLIVYNTGSGLIVINDLDLESYLLGVVPAEMPSKWNIEAHKAQAIAARSYAIANLGKRAKYGYDLKDTPEDQAYCGTSCESKKTDYAVVQTKGQVLVYGNKVIPAYYCSSAGGYTVNAGSVWLRDLPFVNSVPSFDGFLPKNGHGVGMSQHGANIMANYGYSAYQILGYFYKNVRLYRVNL